MARLNDTINTTRGRTRIRNAAFKNVTYLIELRDKYYKEGKHAELLEIITIMLPYQLPKLSSIEVAPDVEGTMQLLQEIKQQTLKQGIAEAKQLESGQDNPKGV